MVNRWLSGGISGTENRKSLTVIYGQSSNLTDPLRFIERMCHQMVKAKGGKKSKNGSVSCFFKCKC